MGKKLLTKKQQTILALLFTFRFINSKQIQQFLNHKDHRRINSWLKDLAEKGYIVREFKLRYGVLTKPTVCSLTNLGKKHIQETYNSVDKKYLNRLRDNEKRSNSLKVRCQVLVDFYLIIFRGQEAVLLDRIEAMLKNGVTMNYNTYQFFTPAFFYGINFVLLSHLKSDAYVYRRTKEGSTHTFLYIIDAYVPKLTLQYMLKHIFTALSDEYWEEDTITALHLYFVSPSNAIIIYLWKLMKSFLENHYASTPLFIHFATRNQLYKKQRDHTAEIGWRTISSQDLD